MHPQTFTYSVPVDTSTCGSFDMPNVVNLINADAATLDNYNSGLIGPGHCGENSSS